MDSYAGSVCLVVPLLPFAGQTQVLDSKPRCVLHEQQEGRGDVPLHVPGKSVRVQGWLLSPSALRQPPLEDWAPFPLLNCRLTHPRDGGNAVGSGHSRHQADASPLCVSFYLILMMGLKNGP